MSLVSLLVFVWVFLRLTSIFFVVFQSSFCVFLFQIDVIMICIFSIKNKWFVLFRLGRCFYLVFVRDCCFGLEYYGLFVKVYKGWIIELKRVDNLYESMYMYVNRVMHVFRWENWVRTHITISESRAEWWKTACWCKLCFCWSRNSQWHRISVCKSISHPHILVSSILVITRRQKSHFKVSKFNFFLSLN